MPLGSYLCSRDFGSHPTGTNKVQNLKHSNKGGVLRFCRAIWCSHICWQLLLGEGVIVLPCGGRWLTLFHMSEDEISGVTYMAGQHCSPPPAWHSDTHPHWRSQCDPVPQSSLLRVWDFEVKITNVTRLRIKTWTLASKCLLLVLINSPSSSVARY